MSKGSATSGNVSDWRARSVLNVVDSHTCGQPTRVLVGGMPFDKGMDPCEARELMKVAHDGLRRLAILEPRGHRSMFGAALIPPLEDGEPYGVVFMDANGYPDMCGHATIGTATTLLELSLVRPPQPEFSGEFEFDLRTPAGLLNLRANMQDGHCQAVAFRSPRAYYVGDVNISLDGVDATVEVGFGGQYYAFLPASLVGLEIEPDSIDALIREAARVRRALADHDIVDPVDGTRPTLGNIVWTGTPTLPNAHGLNVPVSSGNAFDRSPCGTATCARMAILEAKGDLAIGETFVNQSIMRTTYVGSVIARTSDGLGIVPEVEGRAWLTARSELLVDETDPLRQGYLIGNGAAQF